MRTYIINLAQATDRREYLKEVLKDASSMEIKWIEGVDGRCLTDDEIKELFDGSKFSKTYLRSIRRGELGCVLSHQKCYKDLLDSEEEISIVFEDDIVLKSSAEEIIRTAKQIMPLDKPAVLLLSGWYWYSRKRPLDNERFICKVIDARLAHAYVINREAARIMYHQKPYFLADDWGVMRRRGIEIYGLMPPLVNQNWSPEFHSQTNTGPVELNFRLTSWIKNILIYSLPRRIAKIAGHFVSPD